MATKENIDGIFSLKNLKSINIPTETKKRPLKLSLKGKISEIA